MKEMGMEANPIKRKLKLNDATLVCIDCVNVERAVKAIEKTLEHCSFDKILLLTSLENNYKYSLKINQIKSIDEYSIFCIKELYKFIDTKYLMIIQHDGYVVNPNKWRDEFYDYDYVGAMCGWVDNEGKGGNGGISWRSTALLESASKTIPTPHCHPEDVALSGKIKGVYPNGLRHQGYRSELESLGFKFAASDVQKLFAFEFIPYQWTFAHHKGNIHDAYEAVQMSKGYNDIEIRFQLCKKTPSDINEHLETLRRYAEDCEHVTEMGVRGVVSTWAFLAANPKRLVSYDIGECSIGEALILGKEHGVDFEFRKADVLDIEIEPTDLLFIDTHHAYSQLTMELNIHSSKVKKYIIMHDTITYAYKDERHWPGYSKLIEKNNGKSGIASAIQDFLLTKEGDSWQIKEAFKNNNGLTVLERKHEDNL